MSKHTLSARYPQDGSPVARLCALMSRQILVVALLTATGVSLVASQAAPLAAAVGLSATPLHATAIHIYPWGCGGLPLPC